ncbi:30S ribosomal protein S1 [Corynebacterium ciconiae DSM 44920]|uniref:Tex family protein n=1 Tax=Corynebacterium ciconiae TaxID=227319 RepID=UPI00036E4F1D|nr:Tex family protein [Corynebacterium ciconiae]WKD61489.1 30S ribosomal protein S1 [Corynebacterium ciconiae DSM 44920]
MIARTIAEELRLRPDQVEATIALLDEGNTVPFIARYRKEVTGGLDDSQLRVLAERLDYLRELAERKETVLAAIEEQGKLSDELRAQIEAVDTKARLEDLYLPYKKRRTTKADKARAAGLEPLLDTILAHPEAPVDTSGYTSEDFPGEKEILDGARAILIDRCALNADLVGEVRQRVFRTGVMTASVNAGAEDSGAKYKDYFDFSEPLRRLPSHRILALLRGEKEGVLTLSIDAGSDEDYEAMVAAAMDIPVAKNAWLAQAVRFAWRTKLYVSASLDARMKLKETAEQGALEVFSTNLRDVLLAAPAGQRATMGLDPGYRNGVKVAVVSATGMVLATTIVYPHQPQNRWDAARAELAGLCAEHGVELIAVGNGTASRETDTLAREIAEMIVAAGGRRPTPVVVSESGASVYSASELAAKEFPDMDVSLRGAVSIARRLQDPLAELVKIDPKSIGVGQYQHDVNQVALARSLDGVVESAVNAVGVDVNTASVPLLERVAGVSSTVAKNIVAYREQEGSFSSRAQLKKVPRLGPKAFEQAAGFLRIHGAADPLDSSAVHPEAYPVARRMAESTGLSIGELIGNSRVLSTVRPEDFADERFGVPTVTDILAELDKPGRDPRPEFTTARFKEGVEKISDLSAGMILEGTVTNVAAFGAFVDVGVHHDGLVHVSAMSDRYVSDPHEVVRSGEVVKVKVLDIDVPRKRISLTLRLDDATSQPTERRGKDTNGASSASRGRSGARRGTGNKKRRGGSTQQNAGGGAMADALKRAGF